MTNHGVGCGNKQRLQHCWDSNNDHCDNKHFVLLRRLGYMKGSYCYGCTVPAQYPMLKTVLLSCGSCLNGFRQHHIALTMCSYGHSIPLFGYMDIYMEYYIKFRLNNTIPKEVKIVWIRPLARKYTAFRRNQSPLCCQPTDCLFRHDHPQTPGVSQFNIIWMLKLMVCLSIRQWMYSFFHEIWTRLSSGSLCL